MNRSNTCRFSPELVGRPGVDIKLGKGSGLANIEEHLERRGLTFSPEQADAILQRVKLLSIRKKGLLTSGEFESIAAEVLGAAESASAGT